MDCKRTHKIIGLYLTGALAERERSRFEAHIASCPACRDEVARYEKAYDLLGRIEDIKPSPDFLRKLNSRIRRSHAEPAARPGILRRVPVWVRGVAAVAACVAIGLALWALLRTGPTPTGPGTPGTTVTEQEEQEIVQNLGLLENLDVLEAGENGDIKVYSGKEFDTALTIAEKNIDTADITTVEKDDEQNP